MLSIAGKLIHKRQHLILRAIRHHDDPLLDRTQTLVEDTYLWRVRIRREVLDVETVPRFVEVAQMCFGDTDGWFSKFHPFDEYGVLHYDYKQRGPREWPNG